MPIGAAALTLLSTPDPLPDQMPRGQEEEDLSEGEELEEAWIQLSVAAALKSEVEMEHSTLHNHNLSGLTKIQSFTRTWPHAQSHVELSSMLSVVGHS